MVLRGLPASMGRKCRRSGGGRGQTSSADIDSVSSQLVRLARTRKLRNVKRDKFSIVKVARNTKLRKFLVGRSEILPVNDAK
jgi:hypothetical protein